MKTDGLEQTVQVLKLTGAVGGEEFNVRQVQQFLTAAAGAAIRIQIASGGGCSATSMAIYHLLKGYPGQLVAEIHHAGSSAVLPALAPQHRAILTDGSIFVHRSWTTAVGTCRDLAAAAERLLKLDELESQLYAKATGQTVQVIEELVNQSTVLKAHEALKFGFVHQVLAKPGGEAGADEVWIRTAGVVVRNSLAVRSAAGQSHEAKQSRGLATYEAVRLAPDYPRPAASKETPVTAAESAVLRLREQEQLRALDWRLRAAANGNAPDPRVRAVMATWRCSVCGSRNFHPPGQDGRPTNCRGCGKGD